MLDFGDCDPMIGQKNIGRKVPADASQVINLIEYPVCRSVSSDKPFSLVFECGPEVLASGPAN